MRIVNRSYKLRFYPTNAQNTKFKSTADRVVARNLPVNFTRNLAAAIASMKK